MKTTSIAKAISFLIACSILALFLVPTGFAYIAGAGGSDSAQATSCNSKPSSLSIFPFARLKANSAGSASVVEVHLSSANGACSSMIYSSHKFGYDSVPDHPAKSHEASVSLR